MRGSYHLYQGFGGFIGNAIMGVIGTMQIFAEAYSRDPGFFAFYRSMQAYETGLRSNDTRMLLRPDSDFFRYFVDPAGKPREEGNK